MCRVEEAFPASASTTDSIKPPFANCIPRPLATSRPIDHALNFIKIKEHHFLQAHFRSQLSLSSKSLWSAELTAFKPILKNESSIHSDSTAETASPGKQGKGGILAFHGCGVNASACTWKGLFIDKSQGIVCSFLDCRDVQQNCVCNRKASGVPSIQSVSSLVRLQLAIWFAIFGRRETCKMIVCSNRWSRDTPRR